jgi:hypothetical protein
MSHGYVALTITLAAELASALQVRGKSACNPLIALTNAISVADIAIRDSGLACRAWKPGIPPGPVATRA